MDNLHHTNGFGIGLSFSDISGFNQQELPDNARDFEILVEKPLEPYQFISPAIPNTPQTATVSPHSYAILTDTDQLDHDRIVIERFGWSYTGIYMATKSCWGY
jgi:hypothetical protein